MKPKSDDHPFVSTVLMEQQVPVGHEAYSGYRPIKEVRQSTTPWDPLGNGGRNRKGVSVRAVTAFKDLSSNYKASWSLFTLLEKRDRRNNVVFLPRSSLTNAEYQRLVKGLPTLIKQHLVVRLGHERYMINPDLMQPDMYDDALQLWNKYTIKQGVLE